MTKRLSILRAAAAFLRELFVQKALVGNPTDGLEVGDKRIG